MGIRDVFFTEATIDGVERSGSEVILRVTDCAQWKCLVRLSGCKEFEEHGSVGSKVSSSQLLILGDDCYGLVLHVGEKTVLRAVFERAEIMDAYIAGHAHMFIRIGYPFTDGIPETRRSAPPTNKGG